MMIKKMVALFAIGLFPVVAMASTAISNPGPTAGIAIFGKGHCVYASRVVLPGGFVIHKNKQGKSESIQVCTLMSDGMGKFLPPESLKGKPIKND